MHKLLDQWVYC